MIRLLFFHTLFIFLWCLIRSDFSIVEILIGFFLGLGATWAFGLFLGKKDYPKRVVSIFIFLFKFMKALFKANLQVAYLVFFPRKIQSKFIVYPLEVKGDIEITLLANSITLTPGTMTVDVSKDRQRLFIHTLFGENGDLVRKEIYRDLEKPILKISR